MSGPWEAPAEPGPDVTHVCDSRDVVWCRDGEFWWADIGHGWETHRTWTELLARGPLHDATAEGRQPH